MSRLSDLNGVAPNSQATPDDVTLRQRAADMRMSGASYADIGRELGVSRHAALRLVKRETRWLAKYGRLTTEMAIDLENERLDAVWRAAFAIMVDPATPPELQLKACDRLLRISERRSKLLGLDAAPGRLAEPQPPAWQPVPTEQITNEMRIKRIREIFAQAGQPRPK